jgi:hypothetical protein
MNSDTLDIINYNKLNNSFDTNISNLKTNDKKLRSCTTV